MRCSNRLWLHHHCISARCQTLWIYRWSRRFERFRRRSIFCETVSQGFLAKEWWVQLSNRQKSTEISLQNLSQTFRNVEKLRLSLRKSRFPTKCCGPNLWREAPEKPILTPFRPHTVLNRSAKPNNKDIFPGISHVRMKFATERSNMSRKRVVNPLDRRNSRPKFER